MPSNAVSADMTFYQANMKFPETYAYIVVMAVLGVGLNFILERVEKRSFRWRDEIGTTVDKT